jgi:dolichol-phosphate mannosyltransferase
MISIVIPAFNEEENIGEVRRRLLAAGSEWQDTFEVIFVDDGSRDKTLDLLRAIHHEDPRFKVLSFSRNFGHQTAVSAGLRYAAGDAVVVMDADLQDPPEDLARFLAKWREGCQVVYGVRQLRSDEGLLKRWTSWAFYRLFSKMAALDIPLDSGDFCVMDRVVVDWLNAMPERNRFVRGLRSWVGFRQVGLPVRRQARHAGTVKYTFRKSLRLAMDALVNFSYVPLQYTGMLGLVVAALSAVGMAFVVVHRVAGFKIFGYSPQDTPGYASLMLAVLFLGGVQLIAVGVLGEYLGRIFDEVKGRPLYVLKEQLGFDQADLPAPAEGRQRTIPASGRSSER